MGWAEGIRMGGEWYTDYQNQKRQKTEDEYTKEVRDRQRQGWKDQDAGKAAADAEMRKVMEGTGAAPEFDPEQSLGLPKRAAPTAAAPAPVYGNKPPVGDPYAVPPHMAPQPPQGMPGPAAPAEAKAPQRDSGADLIMGRMRAAMASRDQEGFYRAAQELKQHQEKARSAKVAEYVLNADDATVDQLMKTVSMDKQNDYKMTRGKDGYFTITMGEASAKLSRYELAQYMSAKARLAAGDSSALNDIAAIDKGLAAKAKEQLGAVKDVAGVNNTAQNHTDDAAYKKGMLSNDNKRVGLASQRESRDAQAAKMGQVRTYVDKQGNTREMYPVTGKDGKVRWEDVPTPAGMKPYVPGKAGAGDGKDVKLEPGTLHQTPGGLVYSVADNGEKIVRGAPQPAERAKILSAQGFSPVEAESLQWLPGGKEIAWGGAAYDVTNRNDMAELLKAVKRDAIDSQAAGEFAAGRSGWPARGLPSSPTATGRNNMYAPQNAQPSFAMPRP